MIHAFVEGVEPGVFVTGNCPSAQFEQKKEEIWSYIATAVPNGKATAGEDVNLQDYLDFSKSWGIHVFDPDVPFTAGDVFDFAFHEDGTFWWASYPVPSDGGFGGYGEYAVNSDQIEFTFMHEDGTNTVMIYSFEPGTMQLTQVSENGLFGAAAGTTYTLTNHEWYPTAEEVIAAAKEFM